MHIPGTNISPFMLARGRQPQTPNDMEMLDPEEAGAQNLPMAEQVLELKRQMKFARDLLLKAREEALSKSKEKFDAH